MTSLSRFRKYSILGLTVFGILALAVGLGCAAPSFSLAQFSVGLSLLAPFAGMALARGNPATNDMNAVVGGLKDRGVWAFYDRIEIPAAFGQLPRDISLFSIPLGGLDPFAAVNTPKTMADTNGLASNSMPANRCLVLDTLGFYFGSTTWKSDIDNFIAHAWMEFKIEDKRYWEGPLWMYPSGFSLFGVSDDAGRSDACWNFGLPSPTAALHYGQYGKYIAPLQPFYWTIHFEGTPPTPNASGNGITLFGRMYGLIDRSVQ